MRLRALTITRAALFASAGLIYLAHGAGAEAQTASGGTSSPAADPTNQSGTTLPEVIVTAQRREEDIQKVPIAVTAVSAAQLSKVQIVQSKDLDFIVPNMYSSNNVGQGSANTYYIRGLGQGNSFPTFEPQVGTYVDDIYIARSNASNFALFGVSQIQVLNGPQGTLFGRNSTGGAIVVTLNKPASEFGGTGMVSYGSFDEVDGQLSVNIPVSDQFRTLTSGYVVWNDGFVHDITTGETLNYTHNYGFREALTVLPANLSNVEWDVSADYEHQDAANVLNQPCPAGVSGANGSDRCSYSGFSIEPGTIAPYQTGAKGQLGQGALVITYGLTSHLKVNFDSGTLDLITGARGMQQLLAVDYADQALGSLVPYDQSPFGTFILDEDLHNQQYSQEVRWTGKIGDQVNYTAGFFYFWETNPHNYGAVANIAGVLGVPGLTSFPVIVGDETTTNNESSAAVYAQADFKLTSALTLTLGGRFTNQIDTLTAYPNVTGEGFTTTQIQSYGYKTRLVANEFTPRFALQYQIDPNLMVFASATRGFQGGGWNGLAFSAQTFNDFGPETVWSYETGFRSEFPQQRLRLNATGFYEDVSAFQQQGYSYVASSFTTNNVADMSAYGLEGTATWEPIERLDLSLNLGLINAWFHNPVAAIRAQQQQCITTGVNCNNGIVTTTGGIGKPAYTPPVTLSGLGTYTFQFPQLNVIPTVAFDYTGDEWISTSNDPKLGEAKAHTLVNAGVEFAPNKLPFTVTVECKNCFLVNSPEFDLFNFWYYNYPGTWDVRLNVKF